MGVNIDDVQDSGLATVEVRQDGGLGSVENGVEMYCTNIHLHGK